MAPLVTPGSTSFWEFVRLRQEAWFNRASGRPAPYSDDPAIARYHFTNVYRELDPGTRYYHEQVRPTATLGTALTTSIVYRPLNRRATFEAFGGIPTPRQFGVWQAFINARMNDGERVFTGRHQTRGRDLYADTLEWIASSAAALTQAVRDAVSLADVVTAIKCCPGMGDFMAWQVTCDVLESGRLDQADRFIWAKAGPGAVRGLRLVYPNLVGPLNAFAAMYALSQDRENVIPRAHVPPELPNSLSVKNVEHALCEYARWVACRNGGSHGLEVKPWAK